MRTLLSLILCAGALLAAGPRRAPGFALIDTKMQLHDLADYRGKVVIIEFMQTTCPHCAAFVPTLKNIQQKYAGKVAIISIVEPPDTGQNVMKFISGHGITYPVLMDCGQVAYSYVMAPNVSFPRLFLVDGNGVIQKDIEYGVMTKNIFEGNGLAAEIDKILGASGAGKR